MASKRVRLTSDSINCYGTRILTEGIDLSLYEKNPVLLWMHCRGQVVGYMKDIEKGDGELTAEPVFDRATALSEQLARQWEFGSLRMVSVSVDIVETSEDEKYLLPGQTLATIIRSKLTEVSLVDIGGNDDAVVLMKDGQKIELSADGECPLPLINNHKKQSEMDMKKLALSLGLPETVTEEEISAKIAELKAKDEQMLALKETNERLALAALTGQVDAAIKEKRLGAEKREEFIALGKEIGAEKLKNVLAAMQPAVKLSSLISGGEETPREWKKLSDVPEEQRMALRKDDCEEYKRLYRAEYGIECKIDE